MSGRDWPRGPVEPGSIYWNGGDQLLQVIAISGRTLTVLDLAARSAERRQPVVRKVEQMQGWPTRPVPFQVAMSIRDMIDASRARITSRQRAFLTSAFDLPESPVAHPPAVTVEEELASVVDALIERGIVVAVPQARAGARRVRLSQKRGLPLLRRLSGMNPMHDFTD